MPFESLQLTVPDAGSKAIVTRSRFPAETAPVSVTDRDVPVVFAEVAPTLATKEVAARAISLFRQKPRDSSEESRASRRGQRPPGLRR